MDITHESICEPVGILPWVQYFSMFVVIDSFLTGLFLGAGMNTAYDKKTRWFLLHSIGNAITMFTIWDEVILGITHPDDMYQMSTNHKGTIIVYTLHMYHSLFFKLTLQDWIHHIVFVFMGLTYSLLYQPFLAAALPLATINGIPGMIDYFLISMVRLNLVDRKRQKIVNAEINCWFRCPYGLFMSGCAYVSMIKHDEWSGLPGIVFVVLNSIYYGNQAVINTVMCNYPKLKKD